MATSQQELLIKAKIAIEQGENNKARSILASLLKQNSRCIEAWFYLATVVETTEQRLDCFRQALEIDPHHKKARQFVRILQEMKDRMRETSEDPNNLIELRKILTERFDEGELHTLCFDLKVDYDELPSRGKANKARELVSYMERRMRIPELVEIGKQQRPDIFWDDILNASFKRSHKTDKAIQPQGDEYSDTSRPFSWQSLLKSTAAQVERSVARVGKRYIPSLYINRELENNFKEFIHSKVTDGQNTFLIIDRAGSGKTNFVCSLAHQYARKRPTVLIHGSVNLGGDPWALAQHLQDILENEGDAHYLTFRTCLAHVNQLCGEKDTEFLIFIDAINENSNTPVMNQALENLMVLGRGRHIRFCITCRDIYWNFFKNKGDFWNSFVGYQADNLLYSFSSKEYESVVSCYFDAYQIRGKLEGDAIQRFKHPLLLRFYCEAHRGQEVGPVSDIRLSTLFDLYWEQKIASISRWLSDRYRAERNVGQYLLNIARWMFDNSARTISIETLSKVTGDPNPYSRESLCLRLLDEDILIEGEDEKSVEFVYEEFMEYVMAHVLRERLKDKGKQAIIREINVLTKRPGFVSALGIMIYLGIWLAREYDISIWRTLADKGWIWQWIICDAIIKLPESKLDAEVFDVLEDLLTKANPEVRRRVVSSLGHPKVAKAMPASIENYLLVDGLLSSDSIIRRYTCSALGVKWNLPVVADLCDISTEVRENAIKSLAQAQAEFPLTSKVLAASLVRDESEIVRKVAADALVQLGEAAVEPLVAALQNESSEVREIAAYSLGKMGEPQITSALIAALQDESVNVRRAVIKALGQLGDPRALNPLVATLHDGSTCWQAAEALSRIGEPAVKSLVEALKELDWDVRQAAAESLVKIGESSVLQLVFALQDSTARLRASNTLIRIGKPAVGQLVLVLGDRQRDVRLTAADVLIRIGKPAVESLIAALECESADVRLTIVEILGRIGDKCAVKPLIFALKDNHLRQTAVQALRKISASESIEPLIAILDDWNFDTRKAAAEALGYIGKPAVQPLIAILQNENPEMRRAAALALGRIGDSSAAPYLINALEDSDHDLRRWSAEALGRIGCSRSVNPLGKALQDRSDGVQQAAEEALRKIGTRQALDSISDWKARQIDMKL